VALGNLILIIIIIIIIITLSDCCGRLLALPGPK
jgi:hypothetical protein